MQSPIAMKTQTKYILSMLQMYMYIDLLIQEIYEHTDAITHISSNGNQSVIFKHGYHQVR